MFLHCHSPEEEEKEMICMKKKIIVDNYLKEYTTRKLKFVRFQA